MLESIAEALSRAYQYPEICCARVECGGQAYSTANFRQTRWKQASEVYLDGESLGHVEVYYLEECPPETEGPFLEEERLMLDEVAAKLAKAMQIRHAYHLLEESEVKFRQISATARDAIILMDKNTGIVFWNPAAESLFGYSSEEVSKRPFRSLLQPAEGRGKDRAEDSAMDGGRDYNGEFLAWCKDGRPIPVEASAAEVQLRGESYKTVILRDIRERKAQEQRIKRLAMLHRILSHINAMIVRVKSHQELFDEACRIVVQEGSLQLAWVGLVDPATEWVLPAAWAGSADGFLDSIRISLNSDLNEGKGRAANALRNKTHYVSKDIAQDARSGKQSKALAHGFRSRALFPLIVEDQAIGLLAFYSSEPNFFDAEEVQLLDGLAADIAYSYDHIRKSETVHYLAFYDSLTDLPNRAFYLERLEQRLLYRDGEDKSMAVGFLDIGRFRHINDSLGRHVGDRLLQQVARRLRRVEEAEAGFARCEADRFAFTLFRAADEVEIMEFVERLIQSCFEPPFRIGKDELRLTVTFGVALYPKDGTEAETLYNRAEAALLKAKSTAEKLLFYDPGMNEDMARMLSLESRLHRAVREEQFVLHYQPKVNAETGKIMGLEALLRWDDPETGMVSPADFMGVLEQTGMIVPVGEWVLQQAVRDFLYWYAQGLNPPPIAVNVSAIQLRRNDFLDVVMKAIQPLQGKRGLELEITESLIMDQVEENIVKLRELRRMGVETAVDDFGTGYSSLYYIAKLPLSILKIDRAFIVNMTHGADDMKIISTIVSLAQDLKLKIVAEGVDSEEQARLLRLLRCDELQGFLFHRPLSSDDTQALLARQDFEAAVTK